MDIVCMEKHVAIDTIMLFVWKITAMYFNVKVDIPELATFGKSMDSVNLKPIVSINMKYNKITLKIVIR